MPELMGELALLFVGTIWGYSIGRAHGAWFCLKRCRALFRKEE